MRPLLYYNTHIYDCKTNSWNHSTALWQQMQRHDHKPSLDHINSLFVIFPLYNWFTDQGARGGYLIDIWMASNIISWSFISFPITSIAMQLWLVHPIFDYLVIRHLTTPYISHDVDQLGAAFRTSPCRCSSPIDHTQTFAYLLLMEICILYFVLSPWFTLNCYDPYLFINDILRILFLFNISVFFFISCIWCCKIGAH